MLLSMIKYNQDAPGATPIAPATPAPAPAAGAPAPIPSATPSGGAGAPAPGSTTQSPAPAGSPVPGTGSGEEDIAPKPWTAPAVNPAVSRTAAQSLFGQPVADPTPPKEYTPDNFAQYQRDMAVANQQRAFRADIENTLSAPVVYGDGIAVAYNDPARVQDFGRFVADKMHNGLSARDLVLLHNADHILALAQEQGARQHHGRITARRSNITPGAPTVPKTPEQPNLSSSDGRVPSVADLWRQRNPEEFNKFMSGGKR